MKEHFEIFSNLKGVNEDYLEKAVTEMAEEVSFSFLVNLDTLKVISIAENIIVNSSLKFAFKCCTWGSYLHK